ncbi:hypothetical protein A1OE_372 [Candidatus Endolissoclinum faulkneri L2]|uniref:Uncharacterized protein n=1 Tax=Candidatus Endolissoclinum faulkneri L2 TaxID=1193729 RepID=K7YM42_9PROT|nr:hypothetical protein A1OE_372 [Candidatus Endolissoclinum faulkneri L2]
MYTTFTTNTLCCFTHKVSVANDRILIILDPINLLRLLPHIIGCIV